MGMGRVLCGKPVTMGDDSFEADALPPAGCATSKASVRCGDAAAACGSEARRATSGGRSHPRQQTRQHTTTYRGWSGATWPSRPTWSPPRRPCALRPEGGGAGTGWGKGKEVRGIGDPRVRARRTASLCAWEGCPRSGGSCRLRLGATKHGDGRRHYAFYNGV
jgi:hypothetical protein